LVHLHKYPGQSVAQSAKSVNADSNGGYYYGYMPSCSVARPHN
jgi:hypothetical protein